MLVFSNLYCQIVSLSEISVIFSKFYGQIGPISEVSDRLVVEVASAVPESRMLTVFAPHNPAMDVDLQRSGDMLTRVNKTFHLYLLLLLPL